MLSIRPVRHGTVVRMLAALLLVSLVGCGKAGTTSSAGPTSVAGAPTAAYGIDTVTWPPDPSSIEALLAQLPKEIGTGHRGGVTKGEGANGTSYRIDYTTKSAPFVVNGKPRRETITATSVDVSPTDSRGNQATWLYGLPLWAGPKCIDLRGSAELVSAMAQPYAKAMRALLDVPDDHFQWFECTSTVGVDSGVHYKPDEYRYVIAWSGSGGYSWSVEAEGDQERQQIMEALVAAA